MLAAGRGKQSGVNILTHTAEKTFLFVLISLRRDGKRRAAKPALSLYVCRNMLVLAALYFGAIPYRMRDLLTYLYDKPKRARIFGVIMLACSISLVISSLMY